MPIRAADRFLEFAQARGHALTKATPLDWVTGRGDLALGGRVPASGVTGLAVIFDLLDGDVDVLAAKPTRPGGRQRAYFDAVRDLAAPRLGNGPLIRVPAPIVTPGRLSPRVVRC